LSIRSRSTEPAEPVRRYECRAAGDLIHIEIKKFGRVEKAGQRSVGGQIRTGMI
jgi:hypothetical protein